MSIETILIIVLVAFILMLLIETPIAFSLAASGAMGIYLMRDFGLVTSTFGSNPFSATNNYSLTIIPMYILLGMFAMHGRLSDRVFVVANRTLGWLPGGLGIATVGACAGFAAVTGSSVATAATIGKISIREMRMRGYPASLASGIVAAAGTLGILIPPSIVLVLYGVLSGESIGRLLLAGIIPGLLSAAIYMAYIVVRSSRLVDPDRIDADLKEVVGALDPTKGTPQDGTFALVRAVLWIVAIFAIVLAGIYTGQFTVIESGALGAVVALLMLIVEQGRGGVVGVLRRIKEALVETASIASMAFAILVGASIFSFFLVLARVPVRFTEWVLALDVPPTVVLIVILLALVPLGMALESLSIVIIVVPLVHPVVTSLGIDGVLFAILFVKMIEVGLITPPVGMNAYIVSGAAGVDAEQVFRGVGPFIGLDVITVALLVALPSLALWLPGVLID